MTIWGSRETNGNICIIDDSGNISINCNNGFNYNGKVLTKDTDDAIKHFAEIADVNIVEFESHLQGKIYTHSGPYSSAIHDGVVFSSPIKDAGA